MASAGLSLVGFMDQQTALLYLERACVPNDPSEAARLAAWNSATAQLGAAFPNAGHPSVDPIPPTQNAHVQAIRVAPWLASVFQQGWELRKVEIDPLLAYQFHVDVDRSNALCAGIPQNATLADAMDLCLPVNPHMPLIRWVAQANSVIITSPTLNLRAGPGGLHGVPPTFAGIPFFVALPLVQVVRCNGRCYLRNGFHRAYGLRQRNLMEIPCLYRDVADFNEVGAEGGGATFERPLLESGNPPTFGHFSQGRGHTVALRRFSRVIHASWSEYVVPEE